MGYSRHVGRVGGLAVALGVGFAVANSPGIALADETGAQNTDPATGSTTQNDPVDSSPTNTPSSNDPDDDTAPTSTQTTTTTTTSETTTVIGGTSAPPVTISSSGGATQTSTENTTTQSTPQASPDPSPAPTASATATATATASPAPKPEPDPTSVAPPANSGVSTPAAATPPSDPTTPSPGNNGSPQLMSARILSPTNNESSSAASTFQAASLTTPQVTAPVAPNPIGALVAIPGRLITLTTNLISAALTPFLAGNPAAPSDTPLLWGLLAWVRRQFGKTFLNHSPTLAPAQTSLVVDADGEIHGTFGADDADDDQLKYWVTTDPRHGTLEIDQAAGTWTYTPEAGFLGRDTFQVKVSDATGLHLHGLFGLLAPDFGDTDTANVNIYVANPLAEVGNPVPLGDGAVGKLILSRDGRRAYQVAKSALDGHFDLIVVNTADGSVQDRERIEGELFEDQGLISTPDGKNAVLAYYRFDEQRDETVTDVVVIDLTKTFDENDLDPLSTTFGKQEFTNDLVVTNNTVAIATQLNSPGGPITALGVIDLLNRRTVIADHHFAGGHDYGALQLRPSGSYGFVRTNATTGHEEQLHVFDTFADHVLADDTIITHDSPADWRGNNIHVVSDDGGTWGITVYRPSDGSRVGNTFFVVNGDIIRTQVGPDGSVYYLSRLTDTQGRLYKIAQDGDFRGAYFDGELQNLGPGVEFNATGTKAYVTTEVDDDSTQVTPIDIATMTAGTAIVIDGALQQSSSNQQHTRTVILTESPINGSDLATVIDLDNARIVGGTVDLGSTNNLLLTNATGDRAFIVGNSTAGAQSIVTVLNLTDGGVVGEPVVVNGIRQGVTGPLGAGFLVSPDGKRAFLATYINQAQGVIGLSVIDLVNSRLVGQQTEVSGGVRNFTINKTGTVAALVHSELDAVEFLDAAGSVHRIATATDDNIVTFSDDGTRAYLSTVFTNDQGLPNTDFSAVDLADFTVVSHLVVGGEPDSVPVLTDDGKRLVLRTDFFGDEHLKVFDTGAPPVGVAPVLADPAVGSTDLFSQIGRVFFNQTPTLAPVQVSTVTDASGVVRGRLGPHDAECDQLKYTVTTDPEHGTVTIDQATGTWTYTPQDDYRGPDSFVVQASDATGFRFHGLAALFTPGGGYTTSATVAVNVAQPPSVLDGSSYDLHGHPVGALVLSPDGKRAYQITENDEGNAQLEVFNPTTGASITLAQLNAPLVEGQGLVVTKDGTHALVAVVTAGTGAIRETDIHVLDMTNPNLVNSGFFTPIEVQGEQQEAGDLVFSKNANRVYLTTYAPGPALGLQQLNIIDLETREVLGTPKFFAGGATRVVESPNGDRAIQVYVDDEHGLPAVTTAVFDTTDGSILSHEEINLHGHASALPVRLSADGSRAIVQIRHTDGDTTFLLNTQTGDTIGTLYTGLADVAFVGDGSRLHIVADGVVHVVRSSDGQLTGSVVLGRSTQGSETATDGKTVYYTLAPASDTADDTTIVAVDGDGHSTTITVPGVIHDDDDGSVVFSADGSRAYIATAANGTVVNIIDTQTHTVQSVTLIGEPAAPQYGANLRVNADHTIGLQLTRTRDAAGQVTGMTFTEFDLNSGQIIGTTTPFVPADTNVQVVRYNADGSRVYVLTDGSLTVIDTGTGTGHIVGAPVDFGRKLAHSSSDPAVNVPDGMVVSADGKRAFIVTDSFTGFSRLLVVDLENPGIVGTPVQLTGLPASLDVNADHTLAVLHSKDGASVAVMDINGHSFTVEDPEAAGYTATFSEDGQRIYLTAHISSDDRIDNYATETVVTVIAVTPNQLTEIGKFRFRGNPVSPVLLTPDGTRALAEISEYGFDWHVELIDTGQASTQIV